MTRIIKTAVFLILFTHCGGKDSNTYQYQVVKSGNGFEIRISSHDRILIVQDKLPALPGNNQIPDHAVAEALGRLYVSKLEEGKFPPSLSREEVQGLLK